MRRRLCVLGLAAIAVLGMAGMACARQRYVLAYWREMGSNENNGNRFMRIWTARTDGTLIGNVSILDGTGSALAGNPITPSTGRVDVVFDGITQPLQVQVTDNNGRDSDLTPPMCSYPNYGLHSYEMLFVLKDEDAAGVFDSRLYGMPTMPGAPSSNAPCTRSLSYYSTNPLDYYSDYSTTTTWADAHQQTFVADGDRVRAVLLHGVTGGTSNLSFTVGVLNGGPGGSLIASATTADHSSIDPWMVCFSETACPLVNGQAYCLNMSRSGGLSAYACGNNYPNGIYYVNASPVPAQDVRGLVCCEKASASTTSVFSGYVRDSAGQPLAGALITVDSSYRKATSASDGSFSVGSLLPGTYTLKCQKQGYSTMKTASLTVVAGTNTTANFTLYPLSANLLQNPGFETGTLSSWTAYGPSNGVSASGTLSVPSHAGTYWEGRAVQNLAGFPNFGVRQTVAVVPGAEYTASCFLFTDSYDFMRVHEWPKNCQGRIGIDPTGGTSSGSSNIIWSSTTWSQTAWWPISVSALATGSTMTVFLDCSQVISKAYNVVACDDAYIGSVNISGGLRNIRQMPDETHVACYGQVCSASTSEIGGAFYAQESDRTQGIRISTSQAVSRGQVVSVNGTIRTVNGERTLVADSVASTGTAGEPRALGLRPDAIIARLSSLSGVLARTWGTVTATGLGYVVVCDGGGSIKVYTSVGCTVGQFVCATGAVGAEMSGASVVPVIRCRTGSDLVSRS